MLRKHLWKPIRSIIEHTGYNNFSLQSKIMLNYLILLIFPIIIYYIVFNIYSSDVKRNELSLTSQLNQQAVDSINTYVSDLMQLSKQPLYDNNFFPALKIAGNAKGKGDADSGESETQAGPKEKSRYISNLPPEVNEFFSNLLNEIVQSKQYLHSDFIFDETGKVLSYVMINGVLFDPYNPWEKDWFKKAIEQKGAPVVSESTKFLNSYMVRADNLIAFSVSRALVDPGNGEILGVISIFSNIEILRNECRKIQSIKGEKIFIIDPNGSVIYDIDEENITKSVKDPELGLEFLKGMDWDNKNVSLSVNGKRYLIMSSDIEVPQWRFVRIIPEDELYTNVQKVQIRLIVLALVFTLLSLASSIGMSYGITKPLKRLISTMKVIEKGDLSIRFKVKNNDEIGQLGKSFNNMISEVNTLIHDVYITNTRKKEAELNALQAQINPHFIYNTLESIRMMAVVNDDGDTSEMLSILGKLLRYSINTKNQLVTVKEEMDHLKNYLVLQNHRFEDKFELSLDIREDLYDINIIKLVFQPIVENAIYHALETTDGNGVIKIRGGEWDGSVFFEIEDNGIGMSEEQLEKLVQRANDFTAGQGSSRGVGLRNVNERIKLYYGERCGLKIHSELGKGTVVRLELPDKESMNRLEIN